MKEIRLFLLSLSLSLPIVPSASQLGPVEILAAAEHVMLCYQLHTVGCPSSFAGLPHFLLVPLA
jgi:hypothetical protein